MSACVVWIDLENAKLFRISASGIERDVFQHHSIDPRDSHHDNHKHNAQERFFGEVASAIGNVEELLIFGPGMGKIHFKSHLDKHNHILASHVVGVAPLDHLTDNQILDTARKFFKKYNTYNSNI